MAKGVKKDGTAKIFKSPPRSMARDLCMDIHHRVCTRYDAITILKIPEEQDSFGFIVPREIVQHIRVPYMIGDIDYDNLDDELLIQVYQRMNAVIVKNMEKE
jgi:hypothetical protein